MTKSDKERPAVWFIIRYFHPFVGGLEKKALNLARHLAAEGVRIIIVTSRFSTSWPRDEMVQGVRVVRLASPRIKMAGAFIYLAALTVHLWRHRNAFDIIHVFQVGYSSSCAVTVGGLLGKKTVLTLSGSGSGGDVMRHRRTPWGRLFLRLCGRASAAVTLHGPMRDELASLRRTGALQVIPNGVDLALYRPAADRPGVRCRLGVSSDERIIVYAGRLSPEKGVDVLVRAFCGLKGRPGARLWILGDGPQRGALERFIRNRGLKDQVRLLGDVEDVVPHLQAADLFVMPSRFEGMSNALLEAMACGVPVIATDVPGNREIIGHDSTGLLVPYGDEQALVDAANALLDKPETAFLLSRRARAMVEEQYGLKKAVEMHMMLYENLAQGTGGRMGSGACRL